MEPRTRNLTIGLVALGAAAVALWFGEADAEARAKAAEARVSELTRRAVDAEVAAKDAAEDSRTRGEALKVQTAAADAAAKRAADLEARLAATTSELAEARSRLAETEKARADAAGRVNELNAEVEAAAAALAELNAKVTALEKAREAVTPPKAE